MSIDIEKARARLRGAPKGLDGTYIYAGDAILPEALDEIERLRAEVIDWRAGAQVEADERDRLAAQLDGIRAERDHWRKEAITARRAAK